jgi:siderophore synthetase component
MVVQAGLLNGLTAQDISAKEHIERFVNAYLREHEQFDPLLRADERIHLAVPDFILHQIEEQGAPMLLPLPQTGAVIIGALRYVSALGHFKYGEDFWLGRKQEQQAAETGAVWSYRKLMNAEELVTALLAEISAGEMLSPTAKARGQSLLAQVLASMARVQYFLEEGGSQWRSIWEHEGALRIQAAEQMLLYGHPFHPTPKSAEGFSEEAMRLYAPELETAFALHYFAIEPKLVEEEWIGEQVEPVPEIVRTAALQLLPSECHHYILLPSHPWQAEYVSGLQQIKRLMETGRMFYLKALGDNVVPTSSVRTVWDFSQPFIYKLPLNIRITNFVRVNPLEQLKRAIEASRVLAGLAPFIPYPDFTIIVEEGYRTLRMEAAANDCGQLDESFGVMFRCNPAWIIKGEETGLAEADSPLVIASLLEARHPLAAAPLWEAVVISAKRSGAAPDERFAMSWLRRYTEISLIPLLWLFVEYGVSMEAHAQNSLLSLEQGWPARFYVRDLEGVSISRARMEQHVQTGSGLAGFALPAESPALYSDEEAWHRFKYYVLVNHMGHIVHALAYGLQTSELTLWTAVYEALLASRPFQEQAGQVYCDDLLNNRHLPAKANLISRFQERGEDPLYVNIPNPLYVVSHSHEAEADDEPDYRENYAG